MNVKADPLDFWFHESVSCLHDCMAMILRSYAKDPIELLGARWSFHHNPTEVSQEEFYYPSPTGYLGSDLAPYHDLKAQWKQSDNVDELFVDIKKVLDEKRPVILVEDNYYMPNRPAYNDVHAAHLVLVTGYDPILESFNIMEPTPPLYRGSISKDQLHAAVGSNNEVRDGWRDYFFAGVEIRNRWIDVEIPPSGPVTNLDWITQVLINNISDFKNSNSSFKSLTGLAGLQRYLLDLISDTQSSERLAKQRLAEIYTVGWAHLAQTALHAEFLKQFGATFNNPKLLEAAGRVDRLAANWTAFRIFGAHGAHGGIELETAVSEIEKRVSGFISDHERALDTIEDAVKSF